MISTTIGQRAEALLPELIAFRRDLHLHPELSFQETRTAGRVLERLAELPLDSVRSKVGRTGIVAVLKGQADGPTVALRSDMDALPIHEQTCLPFSSEVDGVMHACGHDAHTTMCLGAAIILSELKTDLKGQVVFLFQPAEEILAGAKAMIADGALQEPAVEAIMGIHVGPRFDEGTMAISPGPMMAAADRFNIVVTGKGGHGAHPLQCVDPIAAAHALYGAIRAVEQALPKEAKRVVSLCRFEAGSAFNIIPDTAEVEGTVRTFDSQVQETIISGIHEAVAAVETSHGVSIALDYHRGCPPLVNDPALCELAWQAATDQGLTPVPMTASMAGEDFAFYQQKVPGAFFDIGIRTAEHTRQVHDSRFTWDEQTLARGAAFLAQCAWTYCQTNGA